MADHAILCALSVFESGETWSEKEYTVEGSEGSTYRGLQTNDAPLQYLFDEEKDIAEVDYLCSDACRYDRTISRDCVLSFFPDADVSDEGWTTEEFFHARIEQFAKERNMDSAPIPNPIPFNTAKPSDSLSTTIGFFKQDFRISVDITGGPRDAAILLTLAINAIKAQSNNCQLGTIVYSNLQNLTLAKQNSTFDIVDLISAVEAFSEYGRADKLARFFGDGDGNRATETRKVCKVMSDFSDALALCKTDNIEQTVKAIHATIDDARSILQPETREEFGGYDNDGAELSSEKINANELLFLHLLPSIKQSFIPASPNEDKIIINTIKWCIEHQMLQQALCIYRERISHCLMRKNWFKLEVPNKSLPLSNRKQKGKHMHETEDEAIANICSRCNIAGSKIAPILNNGQPYEYFDIREPRSQQLRLILSYYHYLHFVRNKVMHLDSFSKNSSQKAGKKAIKIQELSWEVPDMKLLTQVMLEALEAIDDYDSLKRKIANRVNEQATS